MSVQKWLSGVVVSTIVVGASSYCVGAPAMSQQKKLGYTIGVQLGRQFKEHKVTLDAASLSNGFSDAYSGAKLKLTDKEMKNTMDAFRAQAAAQMKKEESVESKKNLTEGAAFLKANATKPGVKATKSGLQYKIVTAGKGPIPTKSDRVTVDYEGTLLNGKVFDSSYKRGKPATFPVAGLIPGWTEALLKMPVGSTWMLYVPSDLAYGKANMGIIGPNSMLQFKVHLIAIAKKSDQATASDGQAATSNGQATASDGQAAPSTSSNKKQ